MSFHLCSRCQSPSLEKLSTYSHCPNCLFFDDYLADEEDASQKDFIRQLNKAFPTRAQKIKPEKILPHFVPVSNPISAIAI